MGFIVSQSIETYQGIYDSLYFRIENWFVSKTAGIFGASVVGYPNKEIAAEEANYWGSGIDYSSQAIPTLISYNDNDLEYPTSIQIPLNSVHVIDVPIYEYEVVSQSIDYEYYAEPGNSASLVSESVLTYFTQSTMVGTELQSRSLADISVMTGSMYTIAYNAFKEEYGKIFGSENIIDCY